MSDWPKPNLSMMMAISAALGKDSGVIYPYGIERRNKKVTPSSAAKIKPQVVICLICGNSFKSKESYCRCQKCGHYGNIQVGNKNKF